MTTYKLMYFNGKGLAEVSRYLFAVAETPYEDFRWEFADWPEYKSKMPLGQGPALEITEGDKVTLISQSTAIARYLANQFNLAGKTPIEKAKGDMVLDQIADLRSPSRLTLVTESSRRKRLLPTMDTSEMKKKATRIKVRGQIAWETNLTETGKSSHIRCPISMIIPRNHHRSLLTCATLS
jgi:glutathione S-transferase